MTPKGSTTRARAVITGRVQGVFYRASCRTEAETRQVAGWVRNNPDGSVEAVFEGPEAAVRAMLDWCRRGPPSAAVDHVAVDWAPPQGERAFSIR